MHSPSSPFHPLFLLFREDMLYKLVSPEPPLLNSSLQLSSKFPVGPRGDFRLLKLVRFLEVLGGFPARTLFPRGFIRKDSQKFITLLGRIATAKQLALLLHFRLLLVPNILRRDLPYRSFLSPDGSWTFLFRDLGEVGLPNLPYDYFGWLQPVELKMLSSGCPPSLFLAFLKIYFK